MTRIEQKLTSSGVVKQDMTEIYREWARVEGFEIGSSVHPVLHDALRGVGGFAYTDRPKRNPTYDDTDLALRGYDDRQRTLTQTMLTEEGLAYARRAGLSTMATTASGRHGPFTPSDVTVNAATDRGRFPTVAKTVSATTAITTATRKRRWRVTTERPWRWRSKDRNRRRSKRGTSCGSRG
jgi:hypothetical protein